MNNFTNNFIFRPFDRVLVRNSKDEPWLDNSYNFFIKKNKIFKHRCVDNLVYVYCIPFYGNENLLGTCEDFYMPDTNDIVLVSNDNIIYNLAIFERYDYTYRNFITYNKLFHNNKVCEYTIWRFCKPFNKCV